MAHSAVTEQLPELNGRWISGTILKQDVFSTVERGRFVLPSGAIDAVLRRVDRVPWWTKPLARHFLKREAHALEAAGELGIAPKLLERGRQYIVRSWIAGVPLHIAKPANDIVYFKSAKDALRKLHRAGYAHNDLAKEQNWLRGSDGRAYLTDFQLAARFRGKLFRTAAYEDLRHLLKHKRRYAPEQLTLAERRVLARKSWPTRIWMATGKRVYILVTRGLFRFTDREGGGPRLVQDAPQIAAALRAHPQVSDAVVVAFPDRRTGTGLYAFVQAKEVTERLVREHLTATLLAVPPPERVQVVDALPRTSDGTVRTELLQLIAMNQMDEIDALVSGDAERDIVQRIVAARQNLRDRFAF